ncbi:MAG: hypothetical protein ACM3XM_03445 [Mycobacterium leprae]
MRRFALVLTLLLLMMTCPGSPAAAAQMRWLPKPPEQFADYPKEIAAFLNKRPENLQALKQLLVRWNAISPATPIFAGDVSGLRRLDYIVPIWQRVEGRGTNDKLAGVLWLHQGRGGWQGEFIARPDFTVGPAGGDPSVIDIQVHYVGDLNGDRRDDVLWSSATFGANTGFQQVRGLTYAGRTWNPIFSVDQTWGDVLVNPGNKPPSMQLTPGFMGSAGAGPQRRVSQWYRWNGNGFKLYRQALGSNRYMPLRFVDAEWNLLAGRPVDAAKLYTEVLTDASLDVWPEGNAEAAQFNRTLAAFRLMVQAAEKGDTTQVENLRPSATFGYPPFLPVVDAFIRAFQQSHNVKASCEAARKEWPGPADPSLPPYYWGFANPPFTSAALCPEVFGYTLARGTPEVAAVTAFE